MNSTIRSALAAARKAVPAYRCLYVAAVAAVLAAAAPARAADVPPSPAPLAPFPAVLGSSVEREAVAPGVTRATVRFATVAGPVVASLVLVDPREPTVRVGAVLAHDAIVSKDETVSSMARRTGAVAGINGDYFDIAGTGAPVGVLVRDGGLDRSPSSRVAMTVGRDRSVRFEAYRFGGFVDFGAVHVPLAALNTWPPDGGVTVLTAAYGAPPPTPGVTVLQLAPFGGDPAQRRYRVAAAAAGPPYPGGPALRLAYGSAAQAFGPLPDVGDVVTLGYDTDPPLAGVAAAVGGGPLLLQNGAAVDDPSSPNYADRARRIPAAAALRFADGTIGFAVVDGRHPATSIGVNRAELTALLASLGATDAMLFDSGGSATLVARVLGDAMPSVVNEPSDGVERPVADGMFVYSDAPVGPPARLVVRPERIVALSGARVPLRAKLIDTNGHGLGDAHGPWRTDAPPDVAAIGEDDVLHAGTRPAARTLRIARGGVSAIVPFEIVDRVARLAVEPVRAALEPHGSIALDAAAFDRRDRPVATAGTVRWSATNATIDAHGRLTAGDRDAQVTAEAGGVSTTVTIPVGTHPIPIAPFDAAWRFTTIPANGPGSLAIANGTLALSYDFSSGERAAFATAAADAGVGDAVALSCAFDGDGNRAAVRATLVDRYGDRQTVTFARAVDFRDTRRLAAALPRSMAPPIALHAFYAVGTLTSPSLTTAGTIGVHDCIATVPGAQVP